jgi:TM2 domain-containing membrane protein YozV
MTTFSSRLLRTLVLDPSGFEDVESDPRATWQAVAVVLASSLATGFGVGGFYAWDLSTFILTSAIALVTWVGWSILTLEIGTLVLPVPETHADLGELLRTIGFAAAPGLLQIFAVIPHMFAVVMITTTVWMLAAMVMAVQRALDYRGLGRAIAVCAFSAALTLSIAFILAEVIPPAR